MNNIICTRDEVISSILIEDHQIIINAQNPIQPNHEQLQHTIESIVDPVIINPLSAANKPYSSELFIIYAILILLLAFTIYQHISHRSIIRKLNELSKSEDRKNLPPSPQPSPPKRATDMNPTNPAKQYHHLSSSEIISPGDSNIHDNRKSFNENEKSFFTTPSIPNQTKTPGQATKEEIEVKENKFS